MNLLNLKNNKQSGIQGTRPVPRGSMAHRLSSDPFLDWVIILIVALIVALALVGVGTSVYLGDRSSFMNPEAVQTNKAAMPIDEILLDKVLGGFDSNSEERAAILRNYSAPRDPSLP